MELFKYFFLLLTICLLCKAESFNHAKADRFFSSTILAQCAKDQDKKWLFFADHGFIYNHHHYPQAVITLQLKNKKLLLNGKEINDAQLMMLPKTGTFYFNGLAYASNLFVKKNKNEVIISTFYENEYCKKKLALLKDAFIPPKKVPKVVERKKDTLYHVRVCLAEEKQDATPCKWTVSSPAGFGIVDLDEKEQKKFYNMRDICLTGKSGSFFINDIRYKSKKFLIVPREGHLTFNGHDYHGNFIVVADQNRYYLINSLDIEDYVFSVLRTETWPGWPLEVNKACAIASRTYVVGIIAQSKKNTPYHVKNTTQHQTYAGIHPDQMLRKAVEETHGLFLAYDNKPIVAMFDACCGGLIPAHIKGVNFDSAPYLARPYACTFCTKARGYKWSASLTEAQLVKTLQAELPKLKSVKELKIGNKDKAGVVHKIAIKGNGLAKQPEQINGKRFYALLKPKGIRSFHFSIKRDGSKFTIAGKGIGHHIGLCQWGAREMVDRGYDYKKILQFYYPNTTFMKFY